MYSNPKSLSEENAFIAGDLLESSSGGSGITITRRSNPPKTAAAVFKSTGVHSEPYPE